jgi:hypothetical protein
MARISNIAFTLSILLIISLSLSAVSAVYIEDVQADALNPGKDGRVAIDVRNDLSDKIKDVSLSLDLSNTVFSSVGSSEENVDEIDDDDVETFTFTLSANVDSKPGDYNIPYTITY